MKLIDERSRRRQEKKEYFRLEELPRGTASDEITEGCLVLEGGAFRGLYSQGILDAFMENNINFRTVIGVSAGALGGLNYVSGQIGRSARANLKYRHYSEYIGIKAFEKSRSPLNLDFLLDTLNEIEPLNKDRFYSENQKFIAVATNCENGKTEYFEKGVCKDIFSAIKASASMPFMTPMVNVEGKLYLDGGCSCKIPYEWALNEGYKKIIIIKTRERGFRKNDNNKTHLIERFYRNYPKFAKVLSNSNEDYNRQCDVIDSLEKENKAYVIAPSKPVVVNRLESDMEKLGDLYWLGYKDARDQITSLKEYLNKN